jgi:hypothetical protein
MSNYEDSILEVQKEKYEAWIDRARKEARKIAKRRGKVSADDVHRACPPPEYADPRVMGAVFFPREDWIVVEYQRSVRKSNHGRPIAVWSLAPHAV